MPTIRTTETARVIEQNGRATSLRWGQVASVVIASVILWFVAALFIRLSPAAWFARGPATVLLFAAALPFAIGTVWAIGRLGDLAPQQILPAVAVGSAAAMLCDSIAFVWLPLYGPAERDLVPAAAWLLWGVALLLLAAFVTAEQSARDATRRENQAATTASVLIANRSGSGIT